MPGKGRCHCLGDGVNFIQPRLIEKLDVIPASMTCGNLEIIVTLKNSGELRCLNPKSKFAQNFIKNAKKMGGPQDHRTTGPQDHRTTGPQDHRTKTQLYIDYLALLHPYGAGIYNASN
ncbi:UNVERIFIED_CONTAM: hypothetical protein FKN15_004757 [Acipenser sinensis]